MIDEKLKQSLKEHFDRSWNKSDLFLEDEENYLIVEYLKTNVDDVTITERVDDKFTILRNDDGKCIGFTFYVGEL